MAQTQSKVNFITKTVLLFGATLALMCGTALTTSTPAMMAEFENVPNVGLWISLILTLPALFVVIGGPISGILTDRMGRKSVLVTSLLLCGLSGSAGFTLQSLWAILVSRAILGIGIAGVSTATNALISDLFEGAERAHFLGLQSAIIGLNGIVFFFLGGVLADINWRYAFLAYLPILFLFPLAWIFIREPGTIQHHRDEVTESKLKLDRTKAFIFSATFLTQFIFVTLPVFQAYYLAKLFKASGTTVGVVGAISSAASFLIGLNYGRIKKIFSFQKIFLLSAAAIGFGFLIFGLARSWVFIILAEIILGISGGLHLSNLPTWLASEADIKVRGRANGVYVTMMYFGQFAASIVFTQLNHITGYSMIYIIVSVLSFLIAFGVFLLPRQTAES